MPDIFKSIFDTNASSSISIENFFVCFSLSFILGMILAVGYTLKSRYTKSFAISLVLMPPVICIIIMLVNGNLGAGVAVAGVFGVARYRSAQGSSKQIVSIFIAMCSGLLIGMGYIAFSLIFTIVMAVLLFMLNILKIWDKQQVPKEKTLYITIPEDLNFTEAFDDIFKEYTQSCETVCVRTTNMGSMYKLKYDIVLKDLKQEKLFIDSLRCRNGNLEIMICNREVHQDEL